jgi:Holliday junction resolvase
MAGTPESKVKEAVKKLLKERGFYYYMPVSNGMGRVGAPDIIACADGLFLGIECKAPGKRNHTTPNQRRELAWIREANGIAIVVDDVQQLQEVLNDYLQKAEGFGT